MSINGINNSQPAFTAKTKEGNDYDKTNAGKAVGGVLGTLAVAKGLAHTAIKNKELNSDGFMKSFHQKESMIILADGKGAMKTNGFKAIKSPKAFKAAIIAGGVVGSAISGAILLGIGAAVDKMINKHEAKKADKEAE